MQREDVLQRVTETIREHRLVEPGARVLVAVSGGADSVALLHTLADLSQTLDLSLAVAHLNHQLRGDESDADAAFVEERAGTLGLPFFCDSADVRAAASERGVSLEMAARELRYRFLGRVARKHGYDVAATGHTLNDQAETLLLRLARGAGAQGLRGIGRAAVIDGLPVIRPLRDAGRDDIVAYLRERGLSWREDTSNRDLAFLRNRVRHEILPLLRDLLNPRADQALARAADLLAADEAWLEACRAETEATVWAEGDPARIDARRLAALPIAAQRRIVRAWLEGRGADLNRLDYGALDRVLRLAESDEGSAVAPLPGGGAVQRAYAVLTFSPDDVPGPAAFDEVLRIPGETLVHEVGCRVVARRGAGRGPASTGPIGRLPAAASFSLNRMGEDEVHIRAWQPGDRIVLPGSGGTRKVQDVFTDAKVARFVRRHIPLVVCRDEVIWIPGYQVAGPWHVLSPEAPAVYVECERY